MASTANPIGLEYVKPSIHLLFRDERASSLFSGFN